jgi:hypothetical protein
VTAGEQVWQAEAVLECGGRAKWRHRFWGLSASAAKAAWRFASRRTPKSLAAESPPRLTPYEIGGRHYHPALPVGHVSAHNAPVVVYADHFSEEIAELAATVRRERSEARNKRIL